MASRARRLHEAADLTTMEGCIEELIVLQRVAAEETDPALFHAQLDEIKALMPLAEKRVVGLVRGMLEQHRYSVNRAEGQ